jgi:hypothetical protein
MSVVTRVRLPMRVLSARVSRDGEVLALGALVMIGPHRWGAWVAQGRDVVFRTGGEYEGLDQASRRSWLLHTAEGDTLIEKLGGCNCGSPLRRFVPPEEAWR